MTDPAALLALSERVASLAGPDRDLFDAAFGLVFPRPTTIWSDEDREEWTDAYSKWHRDQWRLAAFIDAEAWESAAMMFVPEGLDFGLACFGSSGSEAQVWVHRQRDETKITNSRTCATPALALLSACLKAHAGDPHDRP